MNNVAVGTTEVKKPRAPRGSKKAAATKPTTTKAAKAKPTTTKAAKAEPTATKAAKVAKAKDDSTKSTDALREAAQRYERDTEHKTAGGNVSVNNGDEVAQKLLGKDLDAVYALAAKALKEDEVDLRTKYKHLNVGMQRMALGNRMRAATKK